MRLRAWAWLALTSLPPLVVWPATRPRYGGTLAVDLSAAFNTLDPAELPAMLSPSIAETLVRINARGEIEPCLAVSWQREAEGKRWRFSLRPRVVFHDGETLNALNTGPLLLAVLKKTYPDVTVTSGGQTIVIQSERALPDLLPQLADSRAAIVRKTETNGLIGTGPFRVASWEPNRRLTLAAFEDYWGGRPFLDSVVINMGPARATADLFDIPFAAARRILPETVRIWSSQPRELLALIASDVQPAAWQALALAIDRAPLVNVLAQRRGEAAFGLLPQWLSGYAFLFQSSPDAARARQLVAPLRLAALTLAYPSNDSFARTVADRIALNARDAGINLQPAPAANGNVRLIRWQLGSADAATELARLAAMLGTSDRAAALDLAKPETLYEAERAMLDSNRILPLLYLPSLYGLAPRVHIRETSPKASALTPRLENLWVDP
ncbi:MAG TPA: ABC transporter substrate-binding protein [Bryobacteraceae bacterium]|nr:ABC transporter substrate-binding protein [Bryobacteraceae bacterium]